MLAGELYDPLVPELLLARERARDLFQEYNATREIQTDARRRILLELFDAVGEDSCIQPPFYCDYGDNIRLGRNCFMNFNCVILDICRVTIGDYVFLGPGVQIYTATHPLEARLRRTHESGEPVTIGDDVWIGGGAILCPGVTIGDRSVIGAGSVVTRDVPADSLAVGNPCRVIRRLGE